MGLGLGPSLTLEEQTMRDLIDNQLKEDGLSLSYPDVAEAIAHLIHSEKVSKGKVDVGLAIQAAKDIFGDEVKAELQARGIEVPDPLEVCDECKAVYPPDADGAAGSFHASHCSLHPKNAV